MHSILRPPAAAALAALTLYASPLTAQTIVGELFDETIGRPIAGGFVHLLDIDGNRIRAVLTDSAGRFILVAPGAGRYQLRAERIGYATTLSPVLTLGETGTVRQRLTLAFQPIALEAIDVEGSRRCVVRPDVGLATARLWAEARKALAIAAWTENQPLYRYESVRYERRLDPYRLQVHEELVIPMSGYTLTPFESAPAEELSRHGYVRPAGDSVTYYGPDAAVLLSDAFLDDHCLRIRPGPEDQPELVGLEFQPVGGRWVPDIAGVLWLDRETAELRYLEYGYTGTLPLLADDRIGGRMEFRKLPNGAWIVARWRIRMPIVSQFINIGPTADSSALTAIREVGGEVIRIVDPDAVVRVGRVTATLEGSVYDSVRVAPLAGATVYLSGTPYATTTDATGRFRLENLPDGTYLLTYSHPRLAATGVYPEPRPVMLVRGASASVRLATPSPATLVATLCPAESAYGNAAHVAGVIGDAATGRPVAGAKVRLSYRTLGPDKRAFLEPWRAVATDDAGRYRFCGVPAEVSITLRVRAAGGTATATFVLAPGELAVRDLEVR